MINSFRFLKDFDLSKYVKFPNNFNFFYRFDLEGESIHFCQIHIRSFLLEIDMKIQSIYMLL